MMETILHILSKDQAGVDGQTIEQFDSDLRNNLYKLWNRMSSESYFPPPVRAVSIPKKTGGQRILGVPRLDRLARSTRTGKGRQGSNALYASYCKLWLNLVHGQGSPAERKMAMVIGRPLLKLNASRRGPRS
jgi:hypothetical protein